MTRSDHVGQAHRQLVVGRHARAAELAAGDLDGRRMVAQERVGGAGGGDARTDLVGRIGGRLAEAHAVPPVGDHPIEDRRRPFAALHDAHDRRVRQPERGHQRVRLGGVAPGLVGLERPQQHVEVVERRDALAALGGMRRLARAR